MVELQLHRLLSYNDVFNTVRFFCLLRTSMFLTLIECCLKRRRKLKNGRKFSVLDFKKSLPNILSGFIYCVQWFCRKKTESIRSKQMVWPQGRACTLMCYML